MRRWLTWLNCGTDQVFGLPQPPRVPTSDQWPTTPNESQVFGVPSAPGVPTSDHHPKPPPPDWWTGGQAQPPRAPEVPTSGRYPTSEPAAEWRIEDNRMTDSTVDREAWLLGQLVEARRQLEAGIDRLRALEERLTP